MKTSKENLIFCVQCDREVEPILVSGRDVYPHRPDLYARMFWKCPHCGNFVGTHKKNGLPLGCIPNKYLKRMRKVIHDTMDPIWKNQELPRKTVYSILSNTLGYEYHTGELRSVEEAKRVLSIIKEVFKPWLKTQEKRENNDTRTRIRIDERTKQNKE